MATLKQRKAVKEIAENHRSVRRAMIEAGYSPMTYSKPKNLTNSQGYKDVLAEYGLTEELITISLVKDIKSKPKKRLPELRLGAEILKMTDDKVNDNRVLVINISKEIADKNDIKT